MVMHAGQVDLTAAEVRVLVDRQFPAWRDLPVEPLPLRGTVNALFRLGPRLVARFPLVPDDADVVRARLESEAALDLVAAWHLLDAGPRGALRADLGSGDLEWARGAAWALQQALGAGWYYVDSNPAMSAMGLRTLERLVTDPPAVP
ncbi:hypothetical protein [Geodermatophilus africanus]|nr:hypothetical protein [Geodermatophilus africanus]